MPFRTPSGQLVPAVTTEQMREVDRVAIEELGPNLFQMMENAGRNLAEESLERLGSAAGLVVACAGRGGNGGGAICAARHLANQGVDVRLCLSAEEASLGDVPRQQLAVFRATSGVEVRPEDLTALAPTLVLDGLIGYSLRGAPRGATADLIASIGAGTAAVIALDVPSGVDATTGEAPGAAVRPDVTLTLALPKTGLAHAETGELVLADIGIPARVFERAGIDYTSPFEGAYRVPLGLTPEP